MKKFIFFVLTSTVITPKLLIKYTLLMLDFSRKNSPTVFGVLLIKFCVLLFNSVPIELFTIFVVILKQKE